MYDATFAGKRITLGVTGGIAAYKSAEWLRNLVKAEAEVSVIMTNSAQKFISPLTFEALSGKRVFSDMFDKRAAETIPHINLGQESDLIIIAPATAHTISRLANGMANDLLSAVVLAADCPIMICPAMNSRMYLHQATQSNLKKLTKYGYIVVEPDTGQMACGDHGPGRLPEWQTISDQILAIFSPQDFTKHTFLITAGPTHEPLDPVRFLSNRSSGKMGYALARAAKLRGGKVILVSGPTSLPCPSEIEMIQVRTASEMHEEVSKQLPRATIIIKAAAVSDYRPSKCQPNKIKKGSKQSQLELTANTDILKELGDKAKQSSKFPFLVGFAAESTNHMEEGLKKLQSKNLNMIVINDIIGAQTGFAVDTNKVTILDKQGTSEELPLLSKDATAMRILDKILDLY